MKRFFQKKYLQHLACLFIAVLITVINRYPILYSDTSTYLASGFELETPADRPITYGLLLRLFSLNGISLLFIPVFQSLLFIVVLGNFFKTYIDEKKVSAQLFYLSVLVFLFSGYYWSLNQLIPDFFTALGFISLLNLLSSDLKTKDHVSDFLVVFVSAASHISNTFIYAFLIAFIFLTKKHLWKRSVGKWFGQKCALASLLLIVSYVIMSSAVSKSKHIFYCGSLAEKGILQEVLKDNCGERNFRLCNYRDSIPQSFNYFVWDDNSPVARLGGWKELRAELKEIADLSTANTKYLKMQVSATLIYATKQISMFEAGEGNGPFNENTLLGKRIIEYTKLDDQIFSGSIQTTSPFNGLTSLNIWYNVTGGIIALAFLYLFLKNFKTMPPKLRMFSLLTVLLLLMTSLLVAYSSVVSHRHGVKLFWLLLLCCFLIVKTKRKSGNISAT